jgi:hypothetical protein
LPPRTLFTPRGFHGLDVVGGLTASDQFAAAVSRLGGAFNCMAVPVFLF